MRNFWILCEIIQFGKNIDWNFDFRLIEEAETLLGWVPKITYFSEFLEHIVWLYYVVLPLPPPPMINERPIAVICWFNRFSFPYFSDLLCCLKKIPKALRQPLFGHQIAVHFPPLEFIPEMFCLPFDQSIFWLSSYADHLNQLCVLSYAGEQQWNYRVSF